MDLEKLTNMTSLLSNIATILGVSFLGVLVFFWKKIVIFFKAVHKVELNTQNIFVAKYQRLALFGLGLYYFDIINKSDKNIVIKSINLVYKLNSIVEEVESYVLIPSKVFSPHSKTDVNSIVLISHREHCLITLMNWENLRTKIGDRVTIKPNSVLSASAFFILNVRTPEDFTKIESFKLKITDYSGQSSLLLVVLDKEILNESINARCEITDQEYKLENGNLVPKAN